MIKHRNRLITSDKVRWRKNNDWITGSLKKELCLDELGHTGNKECDYLRACVRVCVCVKFITLLSGTAPRLKSHMISQYHRLSRLGPSISPPVGLRFLGQSSLSRSSLLFIKHKKTAADTVMSAWAVTVITRTIITQTPWLIHHRHLSLKQSDVKERRGAEREKEEGSWTGSLVSGCQSLPIQSGYTWKPWSRPGSVGVLVIRKRLPTQKEDSKMQQLPGENVNFYKKAKQLH